MSLPLVSVIMPAHNAEKHIGAAIESILSQTFKDWELIVVDDGSTDRTGALAVEYAARSACLRVFHRLSAGSAAARNFAPPPRRNSPRRFALPAR